MNKVRREKIRKINVMIEAALEELRTVLDEEQDYYDNIPENLLGSERAEASEEAIDIISDSIDSIEEVIESISDI